MKEKKYVKKLKTVLSRTIKDRRIKRIIRKISNEELIRLSQLLPQAIIKENMALSCDFLDLSKDDLLACKILYEKSIFHLATYHLQQSVEKLTKSYALILGYITPEELRRNGHITPQVFVKLLQEKISQQFLKLFENIHELDENRLNELKNLFSKRHLLEEIASMDKEKIIVWLETGKQIKQKLKNIEGEIKSQIKKIDNKILKFRKISKNDRNKIHEMFISWDVVSIINLVSNFIMMYILSVITFPHFSFTRYPDGKIKPTDYKRGLGVIDCLDDLIKETECCIRFFEKFYGQQ